MSVKAASANVPSVRPAAPLETNQAKSLNCLGKIVRWVQQNERKGTLCKVATLALVYLVTLLLSLSVVGIPIIHAYNREYLRQNQERDFQAFKQVEMKKADELRKSLLEDNSRLQKTVELMSKPVPPDARFSQALSTLENTVQSNHTQVQDQIQGLKTSYIRLEQLSHEQDDKTKALRVDVNLMTEQVKALRDDMAAVSESVRKEQESITGKIQTAMEKVDSLPIDAAFFKKVHEAFNEVGHLRRAARNLKEKSEQLEKETAQRILSTKARFKTEIEAAVADINRRTTEAQSEIGHRMAEAQYDFGIKKSQAEVDFEKTAQEKQKEYNELHEQLCLELANEGEQIAKLQTELSNLRHAIADLQQVVAHSKEDLIHSQASSVNGLRDEMQMQLSRIQGDLDQHQEKLDGLKHVMKLKKKEVDLNKFGQRNATEDQKS